MSITTIVFLLVLNTINKSIGLLILIQVGDFIVKILETFGQLQQS